MSQVNGCAILVGLVHCCLRLFSTGRISKITQPSRIFISLIRVSVSSSLCCGAPVSLLPDRLVGLVVKASESGRPGVRFPLAPGFFFSGSSHTSD